MHVGAELDLTLHPTATQLLRLLDLALFSLSTWQVVARGSEGGNPTEMQSRSVTSCHPDHAGHRPGDLDTFLVLASHSCTLAHNNPAVVCHSGKRCVHIYHPIEHERVHQAYLVCRS